MSKISDTSKKIRKVETLFEDISDKCMKIINYVRKNKYTESSKIVTELADTCDIDIEQSLSVVMSTVNLLVQDAVDFMDQKDYFDILNTETDFENCQFIAEIWNGDAYNTTECEALDDFRRDIEDQYSILRDSDKLLKKCQSEYIALCKRG